MPLSDQFWGNRYGQITDPFGHTCSIGAKLRNVTEEELREAAKAAFSKHDERSRATTISGTSS
ncbi:MAG: VOC family protein [Bryobacteraceae bacterium]